MSETHERIHVRIRTDLLDRLNRRIYDPIRQRPKHGARSALFNKLLQEHLDTLDDNESEPQTLEDFLND